PIWPIKAMIPLGTLLLLLQGIAKLLQDILIALGRESVIDTRHAGDAP
ncbi:MAG TPA: ABC transporter substrate-binding protein, partial [Pseudomonas sp.]|nr:ABC transporter substrate-binding protein [Pseudomonas sp.]